MHEHRLKNRYVFTQEKADVLKKVVKLLREEPYQYNFMATGIPQKIDSDSCACILGWIGYFTGIHPKSYLSTVAMDFFEFEYPMEDFQNMDLIFYDDMDSIDLDWAEDPEVAASALETILAHSVKSTSK